MRATPLDFRLVIQIVVCGFMTRKDRAGYTYTDWAVAYQHT